MVRSPAPIRAQMKRLTYTEPKRMARPEILEAVQRDEDACVDAVLSAALFEDVGFAEPLVLAASVHSSPIVRGIAMTSIGHMARIHKDVDSSRRFVEVLRRGLADEDQAVRGKADDALDDLVQFVPSLRKQAKHLLG